MPLLASLQFLPCVRLGPARRVFPLFEFREAHAHVVALLKRVRGVVNKEIGLGKHKMSGLPRADRTGYDSHDPCGFTVPHAV